MRILVLSATFLSLASQDGADAFSFMPRPTAPLSSLTTSSSATSTTTTASSALFAKSRKARRQQEKVGRGRSKQFYDAIEDAQGKSSATTALQDDEAKSSNQKKKRPNDDEQQQPPQELDEAAAARRAALMEDAQKRYNARPEVSTLMVDEESGAEYLVQGQKVMDVVTRKAVKLSDMGPQYRLAQMFPGVPPDIREKYRFDWTTVTVPEMVEALKEACSVKLQDGSRGIPPHPSVANKAIDFVLANRDYLGRRMKKTLGRWTMHHASKGDFEKAKEWKQVWKNFLTLENHISAPFRQILQDAEGRVGPNFGNLDVRSFCTGELYERIGNYVVLKGMVAHWQQKVQDAIFYENNFEPEEGSVLYLGKGDPRRYLADSPILWSLQECSQVFKRAQEMCDLFVGDEELFGDFPPEIVFLEEALKIKGGTTLRKYMIDEFCPSRGITPEGLREGMRRFYQQLENMQSDPYGEITDKVEQLYMAMAVGTDDARDPYEPYLGMDSSLDPDNPAYFETYTFNHRKESFVSFFDSNYNSEKKGTGAGGAFAYMVGPQSSSSSSAGREDNPFDLGTILSDLGLPVDVGEKELRSEPDLFADEKDYEVPEERRVGRRHNLGWLEKLDVPDSEVRGMGDIAPGRIIPDDEA